MGSRAVSKDTDRGSALDMRVALLAFGAAVVVGLLGAFVGLETSSLWTDELFTAWVVEPTSFTQNISRLVTDVNPPGYYVAIIAYTKLFGTSDLSMRSFSALCAVGAVVVFCLSTRPFFSLNARMFSAALATASGFWFFQSQNARGYALALLVVSIILSLALRLPKSDPRNVGRAKSFLPILTAMVVGEFVHFYILYLSLAVCAVLFVYRRDYRIYAFGCAVVLFLAAQGYIYFIMKPTSVWSMTHGWIPSNPAWYIAQLRAALLATTNSVGLVAVVLCLSLFVLRMALALGRRLSAHIGAVEWRQVLREQLRADPVILLGAGVPLIIVGGGIVSSVALTPNFTDRNLLICSPFLWALFAHLYDRGVAPSPPVLRVAANVLLVAAAGVMASVVIGRTLPRNEPYREAAQWIRSLPSCRGAVIPIIELSRSEWSEASYLKAISQFAYQRYLGRFAQAKVVLAEELEQGRLPPALRAELQSRALGHGCPVVGWSSHLMTASMADAYGVKIPVAVGGALSPPVIGVKAFSRCQCGLRRQAAAPEAFVFYARPALRFTQAGAPGTNSRLER